MGSGQPAYRIASRIFARFANFLEPVIVLIYRQISWQNLSVFQTVLGSHYFQWNVCGFRSMRKSILRFSSHLISSQSLNLGGVGAPQMTLQQYLSTLPCLPLPSGNLQISFLLHSLSPAELSSPCPRISNCGHTVWVSISLLITPVAFWILLWTSSSSHGLCRKCSEVSYSISSQELGSFSWFLLSRSSSHRHKGR